MYICVGQYQSMYIYMIQQQPQYYFCLHPHILSCLHVDMMGLIAV